VRVAQEHDFDWTAATAERAIAYLRQRNPPLDIELQALLKTHHPPSRLNEKVDAVSAEISAELGEIVHHIDDALHSTGKFGLSIEALIPHLGGALSTYDLKMVVDALADATKHVAEHSRALERRITASKAVIQDLHQELEAVRAESFTDEMTGLANRRRFGQVLRMEVFEARETGDPLCLALADIDNFKRLNDSFGHQTGDRALRVVAQVFQHKIRAGAHACRYGGEEFVLVLPRTELADAVDLANTIRGAIKARELINQSCGPSLGHVTLSIGVAAYRPGEPVDHFVHRADAYLYAAKQRGRDRVEAEAA
jgi:diguanylate cyclase